MRACVCACVCACTCVRTYARVCLLPGVHVSMRIRNIMHDVYLYHNYILQCLVFAGRPLYAKIFGKNVTRMTSIEGLK